VPLPLPTLDRRTWADLVSEARALIPRYAPEWTDHNAHDPGITLVELFAWLSEILMFRADRVFPPEMRAFLRWFGIEPLPSQAASTVLALRLPSGGAGQPLPAGLLVADPASGLVFEVDDGAFLSPAWLELSPAEATRRGEIWSQAGGVLAELTADNCRKGLDLWPLGPVPAVGDALWLGFDCEPVAPGQVLSLQIWTSSWQHDVATRRRLVEEERNRAPCPLPAPTWETYQDCLEGAAATPQTEPLPAFPWFLHYSAWIEWEGWDGTAWRPLRVLADLTRALTLTGAVRLTPTAALLPGAPGAPSAGRWWIRARLSSGGYECPPRLAGVALNAVTAVHSVRVTGPETLGVSEGHAEEVFYLQGKIQAQIAAQGPSAPAQPVIAGSLRLRLSGGGPPDDGWTEVLNWDRSGPFDRHYLVDPTDNSVHLGDGRVGRVVPADRALEALEYRVGGGPAANLAAGRLGQVLAGGVAGLTVVQPFAALGGATAETLGEAHGRALAELALPQRGITVSDWETLALSVPGVPVARAAAIPGYLPELGCWSAPGVVTLVVVPACGKPPTPGADFLAAVTRYLMPRRPLTTELHVVGPRYVRVSVTATLHVTGARGRLADQAQAALDAFFDPLAGGPEGTGWPFGRGVLESDLIDLLAKLPGVAYVDGVGISADSGSDLCDNLALCPTELVDSQKHRLTLVEG